MTTRALNVALRTAHIGAMAVLVGGHAFDVDPERLKASFWLTIGSGVALVAVEAGPRLLWLHQGRGILTVAKLALLSAVPFAWDARLPILLAVIVLGSVGSHMRARYRYYSVVERRVIPDRSGPQGRRAPARPDRNGG